MPVLWVPDLPIQLPIWPAPLPDCHVLEGLKALQIQHVENYLILFPKNLVFISSVPCVTECYHNLSMTKARYLSIIFDAFLSLPESITNSCLLNLLNVFQMCPHRLISTAAKECHDNLTLIWTIIGACWALYLHPLSPASPIQSHPAASDLSSVNTRHTTSQCRNISGAPGINTNVLCGFCAPVPLLSSNKQLIHILDPGHVFLL